jgi:hypothetical protein
MKFVNKNHFTMITHNPCRMCCVNKTTQNDVCVCVCVCVCVLEKLGNTWIST